MARDDLGTELPPAEPMEEEGPEAVSDSEPATPRTHLADAPAPTPQRSETHSVLGEDAMSDPEQDGHEAGSLHLSPQQPDGLSPASAEFRRLQELVEIGSPDRSSHAPADLRIGGADGPGAEQPSAVDLAEPASIETCEPAANGPPSPQSGLDQQEPTGEGFVQELELQHQECPIIQEQGEVHEDDQSAHGRVEEAPSVSEVASGPVEPEMASDQPTNGPIEDHRAGQEETPATVLEEPVEAKDTDMEFGGSECVHVSAPSSPNNVSTTPSRAAVASVSPHFTPINRRVSQSETASTQNAPSEVSIAFDATINAEGPADASPIRPRDELPGSDRHREHLEQPESVEPASDAQGAAAAQEEASLQPQPEAIGVEVEAVENIEDVQVGHADAQDSEPATSEPATSVAFSPVSPRVLLQPADGEINGEDKVASGDVQDDGATDSVMHVSEAGDMVLGNIDEAAIPRVSISPAQDAEKTATMIIDTDMFDLATISDQADSKAVKSDTAAPFSEVHPASDISDGLTLNFSAGNSEPSSTPKVATSLAAPVQFEEGTTQLEMDTAMLKDFLARSKASKSATIARRTSASHRRDSDAIRNALSSPKPVLGDKDINSPSPVKQTKTRSKTSKTKTRRATGFPEIKPIDVHADNDQTTEADTDGETETIQLTATEATEPALSPKKTRRSTRRSTRSTKLPAPASAPVTQEATPAPNKITIKGAHGPQPTIFKTEAQELGILTRTNTRRNKGAAVLPRQRLVKLKNAVKQGKATDIEAPIIVIGEDALNAAANGEEVSVMVGTFPEDAKRQVHWDQQLVYFERDQDAGVSTVTLNTPDELAGSDNVAVGPTPAKAEKEEKKKTSTRAKKVRVKDTPVKPAVSMLPGVGGGKENDDIPQVTATKAEKEPAEKEPEKEKPKKSKLPSPRKTRVPRPRAAAAKKAPTTTAAPVKELGKGLDAPPAAGTRRSKRVLS
jgi:hypothetical protein